MSKIINIVTLIVQVGSTFALTFVVYMIFAMFEYKGGFANFIGLSLFQPLLGLLFSSLTILFCFLIGLPIRLNKKINIWWRKNFYIPIFLMLIGLSFCVTSLTPGFVEEITYRMEGMNFEDTVPNQFLSVSGWFTLAIGSLHLYLPYRLQQKIEVFVKRKTLANSV